MCGQNYKKEERWGNVCQNILQIGNFYDIMLTLIRLGKLMNCFKHGVSFERFKKEGFDGNFILPYGLHNPWLSFRVWRGKQFNGQHGW
jgi:hypothetical protein